IFGSITLIAGIIALKVILTSPSGNTAVRAGGGPGGGAGDASNSENRCNVIPAPASKPNLNEVPSTGHNRMVNFAKLPTFLGNGLPVQAASAADQSEQLLATLNDVTRQ